MNRLAVPTLLAMIFAGPAADCGQAAESSRPNILFILADDLGWKDLSCTGSPYYESPHIDRIAEEGMTFTRGYAACQVCSPSRGSILTGKYPTNHGITEYIGAPAGEDWNRNTKLLPAEYQHRLGAEEITLAEAFRAAGYQTFFAGKWHLGAKNSRPTDHGFQINRGGWRVGSPRGGYFAPWKNPTLPPGPAGQSLPLRLGRETASFIEKHQDQPFFAYLAFYSVHAPIQTTQPLWKKYRDKAVRMDLADAGERFIWDRRKSVRQVQDNPIYAGMIESMDDAVGNVLEKLDELGLADNTIICFTSDNGGVSSGDAFSTSNLPLRGGKGRQWEGGTRVPFLIKVPGVTEPGSKCDVPVSGIDWYPTLLELAGIPVPDGQQVDGVSFVPLLKGGSIPDRRLFWHYPHYGNQGGEPSSIISHSNWKVIYYHEDGRYELYNLAEDPGEQHDLAASHPERVAAMKSKLQGWLEKTGAKFPTENPDFNPAKRRKQLQRRRTRGQERLERRHAGYLDADFRPNADWWDSE